MNTLRLLAISWLAACGLASPARAAPIFQPRDLLGPVTCMAGVLPGTDEDRLSALLCSTSYGSRRISEDERGEKVLAELTGDSRLSAAPLDGAIGRTGPRKFSDVDVMVYDSVAAALAPSVATKPLNSKRLEALLDVFSRACRGPTPGSNWGELGRATGYLALEAPGETDRTWTELTQGCVRASLGPPTLGLAKRLIEQAIAVDSVGLHFRAVARWRRLAAIVGLLEAEGRKSPNDRTWFQDAARSADIQFNLAEAALEHARQTENADGAPDAAVQSARYRRDERPIYVDHARLLLAISTELKTSNGKDVSDPDFAPVISALERSRAADLRERFAAACDESDRHAAQWKPETNELIIYPLVLDDRLEVFFQYKGSNGWKRRETLNFGEAELTDTVERAQHRDKDDDAITVAEARQRLAQAIFGQDTDPTIGQWLEKLPKGADATVIIVPDGSLGAAPWPALPMPTKEGKFGEPLVAKAATVMEPSLALIASRPRRSGRFLAAYAEFFSDLSTLPGAKEEAERAANCRAQCLVSHALLPNVNKAALFAELDRGGVRELLLATHAEIGSDGSTRIRFAPALDGSGDDSADLDQLRLQLRHSRLRGSSLQVLILSACITAVGSDEARLGPAGAALQSGVDSVVATLIEIPDLGPANFVPRLRPSLERKASAAQALQLATNDFRGSSRGAADAWSQDIIWSNFTAVGAWR